MVPEIDCIRSGIRCKKAGERRVGGCREMGEFLGLGCLGRGGI